METLLVLTIDATHKSVEKILKGYQDKKYINSYLRLSKRMVTLKYHYFFVYGLRTDMSPILVAAIKNLALEIKGLEMHDKIPSKIKTSKGDS